MINRRVDVQIILKEYRQTGKLKYKMKYSRRTDVQTLHSDYRVNSLLKVKTH